MRPVSCAAVLSSLSCLSWWAAVGCGGAAAPSEERASTQPADLALRHLQHTSPQHRRAHHWRQHGPHQPEAPVPDAGTAPEDAGAPLPEPVDAGAAEPPEPNADAGAPPDTTPQPLPRDIVAQSALPLHGLAAGTLLTESELWDRLAQTPAVCLGETHDIPSHHFAETRAIAELAKRAGAADAQLAVGFEMFQRQFQDILSAFVSGQIDEDTLLAGTEFATRWGYDFSLYRPMLEQARDLKLPALALNMRTEITRKIGRTGLESLSDDERAELPELVLDDAEHRAFIFGLFGVLPEHAAEFGLEDVYAAQTTWDETMADSAARWLNDAGAGARIAILAGNAHCHESAIPRRLTRRTQLPATSTAIVLQSELEAPDFSADGYDVLIVLEDTASRQ
jgi:uncharacterized iron-regulated protein